jgi:ABC-type multidrug transport system fused ATPase/permease subunit
MSYLQDFKKYIFEKKDQKFLIIIFFGIILVTILEALSLSVIVPVFDIIFFDKVPNFFSNSTITFNYNTKIIVLLIFLSIFLIKNIFLIAFNYFYINFFNKLAAKISQKLFTSTLNQPYIFFLQHPTNNILQIVVEEIRKLRSFFIGLISLSIELFIVLIICFILMYINYKIFLFCFINFSFVIFLYFRIVKDKIKNWSYINLESLGKIQNVIIEGLRGIKDLIIYELRENFANSFKKSNDEWYRTRSNIDFLNSVQKYWLELIGVMSISLALLYFVFMKFDVANLIPIFGLYVFAIFKLVTSFSRIVGAAQDIKFNYPSYEIVLNLLKKLSFYDQENKHNSHFQLKNFIEFNNVSFSYDSKSQTLNKINLKIFKGDCVAIIGKNASGKSTLLNLISALIQPTEGKILIDNKFDLYSNNHFWHEKLSYVQQNIFLLNDTIKKNIILNQEITINNLRYEKIVKSLNLEKFFLKLPNKLETKINDNGANLSGGQKQMISLARALYKNSEIIILDEPNSALDMINTELLRKVILANKNDRTIIMVTHDLAYFKDCFNKVLEVDAGNVNEV